MGLFDSILGAASGEGSASGQEHPLIGIVSGLLAQSGGLQGLANKFGQSGQGNAFQSWVGMGENQPISSDQVQNVHRLRAGQCDCDQNGSGSGYGVNVPG